MSLPNVKACSPASFRICGRRKPSAAVAIPNASDGNRARFVMVTAKATAYIKFGSSGVAATSSDILVGGGAPVIFAVKPFTHFAHLQETAATLVNVVPVEF